SMLPVLARDAGARGAAAPSGLVDETPATVWALESLLEGHFTLWTNHRHGCLPFHESLQAGRWTDANQKARELRAPRTQAANPSSPHQRNLPGHGRPKSLTPPCQGCSCTLIASIGYFWPGRKTTAASLRIFAGFPRSFSWWRGKRTALLGDGLA